MPIALEKQKLGNCGHLAAAADGEGELDPGTPLPHAQSVGLFGGQLKEGLVIAQWVDGEGQRHRTCSEQARHHRALDLALPLIAVSLELLDLLGGFITGSGI